MKIVFFGYDFSLPVLERLVKDGHEVLGVCSFAVDNMFSFNSRLQSLARGMSAPYTEDPADPEMIESFIDKGCECFLSCGYPTKIPPIDDAKAYGVNVHPTLLPHGRGFMPMPRLIMQDRQYAGITIHKLSEKFDGGDILAQQKIDLMDDEDIETLSAKLTMRTPPFVSKVISDLPTYWENAKPQDWSEGSWWTEYPNDKRTFDWSASARDINAMVNAFGRYGMIAEYDERRWAVFSAKAWEEKHDIKPGTVTARLSRETAIAITDGYVVLKEHYEMQEDD